MGIPSRTASLWDLGGGRGGGAGPAPPVSLSAGVVLASRPLCLSALACPLSAGVACLGLTASFLRLCVCPLLFPVRVREVVGSHAPWCVGLTALT